MQRFRDGFEGTPALDARCENCGHTRRLGPRHVERFRGLGLCSPEAVGKRLTCSVCSGRGEASKNVSVVPVFRTRSPERRSA